MFARMFELPPPDFFADAVHVTKVDERCYNVRLFLKRFVDAESVQVRREQTMCEVKLTTQCLQVLFGAQHDVPPGLALVRASPRRTAEQRMHLQDEWAPVIDGDNFLSPAKMFPWFGMGKFYVVYLRRMTRDVFVSMHE